MRLFTYLHSGPVEVEDKPIDALQVECDNEVTIQRRAFQKAFRVNPPGF
jgi:hypothetical protein